MAAPIVVRKATKRNLKARIGLLAPTGGGKTFTLLKFLFQLVKMGMVKKVGVIDTEHRSASKYVSEFPEFDVVELEEDFGPLRYVEAMRALQEAGCDGIGIDSLTHAWAGMGGSLEKKDTLSRKVGFNDFTAWGPVTKDHNALIEQMLSLDAHLIATMRLKMEHALEKGADGKLVVKKIGLSPVQRDGMEYEFDVVADMTTEHEFTVSKTRCSALDGYSETKPDGVRFMGHLVKWLSSGVPDERPASTPAVVAEALKQTPTVAAAVQSVKEAVKVLDRSAEDEAARASFSKVEAPAAAAPAAQAPPTEAEEKAWHRAADRIAASTTVAQLDALVEELKGLHPDARADLGGIFTKMRDHYAAQEAEAALKAEPAWKKDARAISEALKAAKALKDLDVHLPAIRKLPPEALGELRALYIARAEELAK